jgi:hypothetical protein
MTLHQMLEARPVPVLAPHQMLVVLQLLMPAASCPWLPCPPPRAAGTITDAAPSGFVVRGCGLGKFNGYYVQEDEIDGRPAYRKDDGGKQTVNYDAKANCWYMCEDHSGNWYKCQWPSTLVHPAHERHALQWTTPTEAPADWASHKCALCSHLVRGDGYRCGAGCEFDVCRNCAKTHCAQNLLLPPEHGWEKGHRGSGKPPVLQYAADASADETSWCFNRCDKRAISLQEEGLLAATKAVASGKRSKKYHTALGSFVFKSESGVNTWKMLVETDVKAARVGVAGADVQLDTCLDDVDSIIWVSSGGVRLGDASGKWRKPRAHSGKAGDSGKYGKGDTITIELDMNKGTLKFFKNDELVYEVVEGVGGKQWCPAVGFGSESDQAVRLVECEITMPDVITVGWAQTDLLLGDRKALLHNKRPKALDNKCSWMLDLRTRCKLHNGVTAPLFPVPKHKPNTQDPQDATSSKALTAGGSSKGEAAVVVGCAADLDSGVLFFSLNGSYRRAFTNISFQSDARGMLPFLPAIKVGRGRKLFINFGQQPFKFKPPTTEFDPCNTIRDASPGVAVSADASSRKKSQIDYNMLVQEKPAASLERREVAKRIAKSAKASAATAAATALAAMSPEDAAAAKEAMTCEPCEGSVAGNGSAIKGRALWSTYYCSSCSKPHWTQTYSPSVPDTAKKLWRAAVLAVRFIVMLRRAAAPVGSSALMKLTVQSMFVGHLKVNGGKPPEKAELSRWRVMTLLSHANNTLVECLAEKTQARVPPSWNCASCSVLNGGFAWSCKECGIVKSKLAGSSRLFKLEPEQEAAWELYRDLDEFPYTSTTKPYLHGEETYPTGQDQAMRGRQQKEDGGLPVWSEQGAQFTTSMFEQLEKYAMKERPGGAADKKELLHVAKEEWSHRMFWQAVEGLSSPYRTNLEILRIDTEQDGMQFAELNRHRPQLTDCQCDTRLFAKTDVGDFGDLNLDESDVHAFTHAPLTNLALDLKTDAMDVDNFSTLIQRVRSTVSRQLDADCDTRMQRLRMAAKGVREASDSASSTVENLRRLPFETEEDEGVGKQMIDRINHDLHGSAKQIETQWLEQLKVPMPDGLRTFDDVVREVTVDMAGRTPSLRVLEPFSAMLSILGALLDKLERIQAGALASMLSSCTKLEAIANDVKQTGVADEARGVEYCDAQTGFELRRMGGHQVTITMALLAGVLLSSEGQSNLKSMNPYLTSDRSRAVLIATAGFVFRISRFGQLSMCIAAAANLRSELQGLLEHELQRQLLHDIKSLPSKVQPTRSMVLHALTRPGVHYKPSQALVQLRQLLDEQAAIFDELHGSITTGQHGTGLSMTTKQINRLAALKYQQLGYDHQQVREWIRSADKVQGLLALLGLQERGCFVGGQTLDMALLTANSDANEDEEAQMVAWVARCDWVDATMQTLRHKCEGLVTSVTAARHFMRPTVCGGYYMYDPRYLVFELVSKYMLRQRQVEMASAFVRAAHSGQSSVQQMIMGAGKTTVIAPLVSLILGDGKSMVLNVCPGALLEMNRSVLRATFSNIVQKRVYTIAFDRSSEEWNSLENVRALTRKMDRAARECAIMCTKPECCKSLMLKYVDLLQQLEAHPEVLSLPYERITHQSDSLRSLACNYQEMELLADELGRILSIWRDRTVALLDEVDLLLHPLKSELNFPIGEKRALDCSPDRWGFVIHLLDPLFNVLSTGDGQRQDKSLMVSAHKNAEEAQLVLRAIQRVIEIGQEQFKIQKEPHTVLLSRPYYTAPLGAEKGGISEKWVIELQKGVPEQDRRDMSNESLKSLMAEWSVYWLRTQRHVQEDLAVNQKSALGNMRLREDDIKEFVSNEAMLSAGTVDHPPPAAAADAADPKREMREKCKGVRYRIKACFRPKSVMMLMLAREWINSLLPHVLAKIHRVHFGLVSKDDVEKWRKAAEAAAGSAVSAAADEGLKKVVDFQVAPSRRLLAVPFIGKDVPSVSSEFAHPDVVIGLTMLAYRYNGLRDADLQVIMQDLSDKLSFEFGPQKERPTSLKFKKWVKKASARCEEEHGGGALTEQQQLLRVQGDEPLVTEAELESIKKLTIGSFSVQDKAQFKLFQVALNKAPDVCEYYLQHHVFPKVMQHQNVKLQANGVDLGGPMLFKTRLGFSGTPSNLLPNELRDCKFEPGSQAKMIRVLTSDKICSVFELDVELDGKALTADAQAGEDPGGDGEDSDAAAWTVNSLLEEIACGKAKYNALIDTGALITGYTNEQVVRKLLAFPTGLKHCQVAVFLNNKDEKMVVGRDESVPAYPLSRCGYSKAKRFTFYDQVHTTGMDIKQALDARAAVTLGKDMTFRDHSQGCWRMRGIGIGQTCTMIVVPEVRGLVEECCGREWAEAGGAGEALDDKTKLMHVMQWLLSNSTRSEKLQHMQLCQQMLQNVWRVRAFSKLLDTRSPHNRGSARRQVEELAGQAHFTRKDEPLLFTRFGTQQLTLEQQDDVNRKHMREREVDLLEERKRLQLRKAVKLELKGCQELKQEKREFDVGPIWNNDEAAAKVEEWLRQNKQDEGWEFTGEWQSRSDLARDDGGNTSFAVCAQKKVKVAAAVYFKSAKTGFGNSEQEGAEAKKGSEAEEVAEEEAEEEVYAERICYKASWCPHAYHVVPKNISMHSSPHVEWYWEAHVSAKLPEGTGVLDSMLIGIGSRTFLDGWDPICDSLEEDYIETLPPQPVVWEAQSSEDAPGAALNWLVRPNGMAMLQGDWRPGDRLGMKLDLRSKIQPKVTVFLFREGAWYKTAEMEEAPLELVNGNSYTPVVSFVNEEVSMGDGADGVVYDDFVSLCFLEESLSEWSPHDNRAAAAPGAATVLILPKVEVRRHQTAESAPAAQAPVLHRQKSAEPALQQQQLMVETLRVQDRLGGALCYQVMTQQGEGHALELKAVTMQKMWRQKRKDTTGGELVARLHKGRGHWQELAFLYAVWAILALRRRTAIHTLITDCRSTLSVATKGCHLDSTADAPAEGGAKEWVRAHCIQHARVLLKSGGGRS